MYKEFKMKNEVKPSELVPFPVLHTAKLSEDFVKFLVFTNFTEIFF